MSVTVDAGNSGQRILLEAGTNEVEVLVFGIGDELYGVNVAKVREVLDLGPLTALPHSHDAIDGMVRVREHVVLVVNLKNFLSLENESDEKNNLPEESKQSNDTVDQLLLLEFNAQLIAFRVDSVRRIHRVSWNETQIVPDIPGMTAPITSVVNIEGRLVQMLDFESISVTIGVTDHCHAQESDESTTVRREHLPIVFAEDSRMIRAMIQDELTTAGFTDAKSFTDGEHAWGYLQQLATQAAGEPVTNLVAAVISDVEMPRMDGLSLTSRICQHPILSSVPVILFSSLISKDNQKKGEQVGAYAQVAKPRYDILIETLGSLLDSPTK